VHAFSFTLFFTFISTKGFYHHERNGFEKGRKGEKKKNGEEKN